MKKILLGAIACIFLLASCKKDDKANPSNNNGGNNNSNTAGVADNSFKIIKPDGGENTVSFTDAYSQAFTDNGGYYAFIGRFSVGAASTYDRLAIGFKSLPADGEYPVVSPPDGQVANLPEGKASMNITYDGINYVTGTDDGITVKVSTNNGKKKVSVEKAPVHQGGTAVGGGTALPDGCKITGIIIGS